MVKGTQAGAGELAKLEADKARSEAAKAKSEAEKAQFEADQARIEAETALKRAASVAEVETQTKLAEAKKKLVDAESQAFLARHIGTTKPGPYEGKVTVNENMGKTEAGLLAAKALEEAAGKIADNAIKTSGADSLCLFDAKHFPDFETLRSFRFRRSLIEARFKAAGVKDAPAPLRPDAGILEVPVATTVSAGLEALSNILGFFKTDYTVGGIDVSLDDSMLSYAVAGAIKQKGADKTVRLPLVSCSAKHDTIVSSILEEFRPLEDLRQGAVVMANLTKGRIESLQSEDPVQGNAEIAFHRNQLSKLQDAIKSYDDYLLALLEAAGNESSEIDTLMLEHFVEDECKESLVLLLRLEDSGGGYLIKRNLCDRSGLDSALAHGRRLGQFPYFEWNKW